MTTTIIIIICSLLLFAYLFDISASKTKVPSVILLLLLGYAVRQVVTFFKIPAPDLSSSLPVLGTVGLILIVLEGSLELELNRSRLPLIIKSVLVALFPILLFSFGLAYCFQYYGNVSLKAGLINAIPLAIISSAVAIPSVKNLVKEQKEFITYESSLSDIFGVLFFNFITLNNTIETRSAGHFLLDFLLILFITFFATLGLAFLLNRIKHHVKYAPIILMVVLMYAIAKMYHLPALIFIMLFGLFLGNLDELKQYKFIQKLKPDILNREVRKFRELTVELTFLTRALFFLLFGFLIKTNELLNTGTILWAAGICAGIYVIRLLFFKLFRLPLSPMLFIAPRGLITILLFLDIPAVQQAGLASKSLIIQVIILCAFIMMFGLLSAKSSKPTGDAPAAGETL